MNQYGSEYFLAILRNKREEKAKRTYNEVFRSGVQSSIKLFDEEIKSLDEYASIVTQELQKIQDEISPSHRMLGLDALGWGLGRISAKIPLTELWRKVGDLSEMNISISLRWWSEVNEYLYDKLGDILFEKSKLGTSVKKFIGDCLKKLNWDATI